MSLSLYKVDELNNYSSYGIEVEKNKRKSNPASINEIKGRITGATPLIVPAVYLLIGFTTHVWHPGWIVFFIIPISGVLIGDKDDDED